MRWKMLGILACIFGILAAQQLTEHAMRHSNIYELAISIFMMSASVIVAFVLLWTAFFTKKR